MSYVFSWKIEDFEKLVKSCEYNMATKYILKYMPEDNKIIEAGCGLGRYVVYLSELGYNIEGIEISQETIDNIKKLKPKLNVRVGDVAQLPYEDNVIAGIISLGVVEHFIEGPQAPLREMKRVLKNGSYMVITVPSLNYIRQFKHIIGLEKLKKMNFLRTLTGKKIYNKIDIPKKYKYKTYEGKFFEYQLTPKEFEAELINAGFEIIESVPVGQIGGLYHECGKWFVKFRDEKFYPNAIGKLLNSGFSKIPFFHNHMHLCVVRK